MVSRRLDWRVTAVQRMLALSSLLLAIMWGAQFAAPAYIPLRYAQNLSAGLGFTYNPAGAAAEPVVDGLLFIGGLALGQRWGIPVLPLALWGSAAGWAVCLLVVARFAGRVTNGVGGVTAVGLLVLAPLYNRFLGTAVPWMLTWAWLAVLLSLMPPQDGGRRWIRPLTFLLLLLTHFSLESVALVLLLTTGLIWRQKSVPWRECGFILLAVLLWLGTAVSRQWPLAASFQINPDPVLDWLRQLGRDSQLYGLFLPFVLGGGGALWRRARPVALILAVWLLLAGLAGHPVAVAAILLFLTGIGAGSLSDWLASRVQLTPWQLNIGLGLVLAVFFLPALLASWRARYGERPLTDPHLVQEIAAWIQADAPPDATLLAAEPAPFFTGLAAFPIGGQALNPIDYQSYLLGPQPPDYLLFSDSGDWLRLTRMAWFRERYAPLQVFPSAIAAAPYIVWGYRDSQYNLGQRELMQVSSPAGIELVGRQFAGQLVSGAEQIGATIYWRSQWRTEPFYARLQLNAVADGQLLAQSDQLLPAPIQPDWQTGKVLTQTLALTLPEHLPYGAYSLNLSFHDVAADTDWPLYQDNDKSPLDRVLLGYVAVGWPTAVPQARPSSAVFGSQIKLKEFTISDDWTAGGTSGLTLYWQAVAQPDQTYFMFLHLLDEAGNLVVNINEQPTRGQFPMAAWFPGAVIRDEWAVALPPDLSPGLYQVQIGLFDLASGERLPLEDETGQIIETGALPLLEIRVR